MIPAGRAPITPPGRRRAVLKKPNGLFPVPDKNHTLAACVRLAYGDIDQSIAPELGGECRRLLTERVPGLERAHEQLVSDLHPRLRIRTTERSMTEVKKTVMALGFSL